MKSEFKKESGLRVAEELCTPELVALMSQSSYKLEDYIKNNPNSLLHLGRTVDNKIFIRPLDWSAVWKERKLLLGGTLELYSNVEEAEIRLTELESVVELPQIMTDLTEESEVNICD